MSALHTTPEFSSVQKINADILYVRSVLSGRVASCVPCGSLEPPQGARCRTRSGFRAWLRRHKLPIPAPAFPIL